MRVCDAAVAVLWETGNDAVMAGDSVLLHKIAAQAGLKSRGWRTEKAVLDALSRQPGSLEPHLTLRIDCRLVRIFRLQPPLDDSR